jgi:hypothetical protein
MEEKVQYELCETCEKKLEEAGVYGPTAEEMIEQGIEFGFDLAVALAEHGHKVKRKDEQYVTVLQAIDPDPYKPKAIDPDPYKSKAIDPDPYRAKCEEEEKLDFFNLNEEGKRISYRTFTNADILAFDWIVVK